MTAEKKLDPLPWQVYANGVPDVGWRRVERKARFTNLFSQVINDRFEPREGYSKTREDYPA